MNPKAQRRKMKISALDKYVIYCIVFFTLYVVAELATSSITSVTNDTLTNAVKWFCGGEVFLCAMIKRHKLIDARKAAKEFKDDVAGSMAEGGMYDD